MCICMCVESDGVYMWKVMTNVTSIFLNIHVSVSVVYAIVKLVATDYILLSFL